MKPNLISNTLIYGLSGTLVALIPFVLLPFMTRALSQGDFGTALFFSALTTIALPFIGLGASNAISVRFFQLDTNKLSNYIWSCIFLNFVSTFFLIFIFYFSHTLFSDLLIIDSSWIYLSICI